MIASVYGIPPTRTGLGTYTRHQVGLLMKMIPHVHPWSSKFGEEPVDYAAEARALGKKYGVKVPENEWRPAREEKQDTIGGWSRASDKRSK